MDFDAHLARWNNNRMRGAARKFARELGVSETYVSSWRAGRNVPGEDVVVKIAELFSLSPAQAAALFPKRHRGLADRLESLAAEVKRLSQRVAALESASSSKEALRR